MDRVRVGMIGAGAHANFAHYPSLAAMDDVEIVAVCDLNEERSVSYTHLTLPTNREV